MILFFLSINPGLQGFFFFSLKDKLVRQGNDALGFHDNVSQKSSTCCITTKHFENHFLATPQAPRDTELHLPFPQTWENYTHDDRENRSLGYQKHFKWVYFLSVWRKIFPAMSAGRCAAFWTCLTLHFPLSSGLPKHSTELHLDSFDVSTSDHLGIIHKHPCSLQRKRNLKIILCSLEDTV